MDGDEFMATVDAHRARGDLEPQLLTDELKRRRVVAVLELDMAVAVELGLGPHRTLRCNRRQRLKHRLLGLCKQCQRTLARGAVDAVAGLLENPRPQLLIGVFEAVKLAQRHEAGLDKFHARFYASLFFRIPNGTRVDSEGVAERELAIGALYLGLVIARSGDRAFRVVDLMCPF